MERTEKLTIRCTPEEKEMLFAKAAKLGLTVTGFLMWEALGEELGQMMLDGFIRPRKKD